MFSGIIQQIGRVDARESSDGDLSLTIDLQSLADTLTAGESIAVNGVCLTVVSFEGTRCRFDVSAETLNLTTLGELSEGSAVNLELAMRLNDLVGGHLVSGHVDTIGRIVAREPDARSTRFRVSVAEEGARFIATKGSVCIDGISLTVNDIEGSEFGVNIVPHTLENTTLGDRQPGDRVNVEYDLIARYLDRLAFPQRPVEE